MQKPKLIPSQDWQFQTNAEAEEFSKTLVETMQSANLPAISAPYLGDYRRVIAIQSEPIYVLFNPVITANLGDPVMMEEFDDFKPGYSVSITRYQGLRLRFQDHFGTSHTKKFVGLTARYIWHQMAYLDGYKFDSGVSRIQRSRAKTRYEKRKKKLLQV